MSCESTKPKNASHHAFDISPANLFATHFTKTTAPSSNTSGNQCSTKSHLPCVDTLRPQICMKALTLDNTNSLVRAHYVYEGFILYLHVNAKKIAQTQHGRSDPQSASQSLILQNLANNSCDKKEYKPPRLLTCFVEIRCTSSIIFLFYALRSKNPF